MRILRYEYPLPRIFIVFNPALWYFRSHLKKTVQKVIRDYNSQMKSAREDGRHDALRELIGKKLEKGMPLEDIAEFMELNPEEVRELAEEWKKEQ